MTGIKAQVKKFLRSKGIKTITDEKGIVKRLGNAKTVELLKVAAKLGF